MITVRFAHSVMHVDHQVKWIETRFPDDSFAPATPNYRSSDLSRARDLGYGTNTWLMSLDHEALHNLVPELMYGQRSVILWNVAQGQGHTWPDGGREEEGYVMSLQRFLNRGEVDDLVHGFFDRCREQSGLSARQATARVRALLAEVRGVAGSRMEDDAA